MAMAILCRCPAESFIPSSPTTELYFLEKFCF